MPENARRRRKIDTGGPWGGGLLTLGIVLTTYGIALIMADPSDLRGTLAWINTAVPVAGWGMLWIGAGVWSVGRALTPPQHHIDVAPAVGVLCLWSGLFLAYWLVLGITEHTWTRDWIGGVIYGAFAAVIIEFSRCVNPPRTQ